MIYSWLTSPAPRAFLSHIFAVNRSLIVLWCGRDIYRETNEATGLAEARKRQMDPQPKQDQTETRQTEFKRRQQPIADNFTLMHCNLIYYFCCTMLANNKLRVDSWSVICWFCRWNVQHAITLNYRFMVKAVVERMFVVTNQFLLHLSTSSRGWSKEYE